MKTDDKFSNMLLLLIILGWTGISTTVSVAQSEIAGERSQNNKTEEDSIQTVPWSVEGGRAKIVSHVLDKKVRDYQVTERGPNHRVWTKVDIIQNENGEEEELRHSYTELASGIHYWDEGSESYKDSKALIEPHPKGAVALHGPQKVIFTGNLNRRGAVDILGPDGVRLQGSVLGLTYFDEATGEEVILATLKDSQGELVGDNQLIYRDAFDNLDADVVYTYRISGLEQDIVLREEPPSPSEFGLNDETTRLESITEWYDTPQPEQKIRRIPKHSKSPLVQHQDLEDEELSFGAIKMAQGKAFWQDEIRGENKQPRGPEGENDRPVMKKWRINNGRSVLYESVEYGAVRKDLEKLPKAVKFQAKWVDDKKSEIMASNQSSNRILPLLPGGGSIISEDEPVMLASNDLINRSGFVLDYTTVTYGYDYTFKGDETYLISGTISFYGTTVFEGGCVIKYTSGSGSIPSKAMFYGPVEFKTDAYRPAIITSMNDNSVGQMISGSSGNPSGNRYGEHCLWFQPWNDSVDAHHLIVRYAQNGIFFEATPGSTLRHAQFYQCNYPIATRHADLTVQNVLVDTFENYALWTSGAYGGAVVNIHAEHITARNGPNLAYNYYWNGYVGKTYLTNSLVVDIPGTIGLDATDTQVITNGTGVFDSVGAGHSYLVANSPYRDAGGNNIDPDLYEELYELTTSAPAVVHDNVTISSNTVWGPATERESGPLDLGYHYLPIDYAVSDVIVANNVTLEIRPGVTIATYGTYGIKPGQGTKIQMSGLADSRIKVCRYNKIQESGYQWKPFSFYYYMITPSFGSYTLGCDYDFDFVDFYGGGLFYDYGFYSNYNAKVREIKTSNCRFYNLTVNYSYLIDQASVINNLFHQCDTAIVGAFDAECYNNLFIGTRGVFFNAAAGYQGTPNANYVVKDNVFDTLNVGYMTPGGIFNTGNNAYIQTNNGSRLYPYHYQDVILSEAYPWEKGPLGDYYHVSNGWDYLGGYFSASRTAAAAGLYHYTVKLNQTIAGNYNVAPGIHYVALNAIGRPLDQDSDGWPDYYEDSDGNGSYSFGSDLGDWNLFDAGSDIKLHTPLEH